MTVVSTFTCASTLFISSFSFSTQRLSTAFLGALSVASTLTVSTLHRIYPTSFTASTITLNTELQANTVTGLLICSSLTVNEMNLSRSIINQPVYGNTVKTDSIVAPGQSVIRTSEIRANVDQMLNHPQIYTFGPSVSNRWVAVGAGTNSISYSNDGFNWIGLGKSVFESGYGVAWNGTMWVAVGDSFTASQHSIAYSYDGISWTGLGKSVFQTGNGVAWNGTMWVAVGTGTNTIAYSYDGIRWIGLGYIIFAAGNGVAWNGTMWVAVGTGYGISNTIAYSYNGISWIGLGTTMFPNNATGIAWNGTMWIAVGVGFNAYSYDGIQWTSLTQSPNSNGYEISWNGTIWVVIANNFISYSYNGIQWISLTDNRYLTGNGIQWAPLIQRPVGTGHGFAWNGTMWVVVGNGTNTIAYSYDGITWTGLGIDIFSVQGNGVAWNGRRPNTITFPMTQLVATGSGSNSLRYSSDGINWTSGNTSIFTKGNGVATNGSIWVATGLGFDTLIYSTNPRSAWQGLGATIFSIEGKSIAWNGTMWVAVGGGTNSIAYSYDGITWIGLGLFIFTQGNSVGWNGFMWVAVGSGTNSIAYSNDGIEWTGLGNILFSGNGIAWNGSLWVAVGSGTNTIIYSYNGITWVGLGATFFTTSGNGIAWNGNRWVAVGSGGNTILYSSNGITWTPATTSCFTTAGNGVTWNGTRWLATGSDTSGIGYSSDGSSWTIIPGATNFVSPQLTNLVSNTWVQNELTWTASASSVRDINSKAYMAFDNDYVSTTLHHWASINKYLAPGGIGSYRGFNGTDTVNGGQWGGEWIQIQCSTPLQLSSYRYACNTYHLFPQRYVIVGSNDGSTWYSLQLCSLYNTIFSINNSILTTTINLDLNGTYDITGNITVRCNFQSYPTYVNNAYTYFRLIGLELGRPSGPLPGDVSMEIGELYLNFISTSTTPSYGIASNNGLSGTVTIQHPIVAVGQGTHSLAYSPDGVQWTGLGTSLFTVGYCVAWNGTKWIVGGLGTNTLAYSYDGIRWTGIGATIFSVQVNGIAWNGSLWVAVGSGLNTIAYSTDGLAWTGSVSSNVIFTNCNAVAWNGKQWVAVGTPKEGTNSIAYSSDGFIWTAISSTIFSIQGNGIAWTGSLWVAVGTGTNTVAYSSDGVAWTPSPTGNAIFTDSAKSVTWNGKRWVAVGAGSSHTIAYSDNGTVWTGVGKTLFSTAGNSVCWTGTRFVAVGDTIGYSHDGLTWHTAPSSIFSIQGNGVAGNPRIGATVCDSQVALSDSIDVVSDTYYNTGYTNFSATIQSQTLS
jgi:hypothetical protein